MTNIAIISIVHLLVNKKLIFFFDIYAIINMYANYVVF